MRMTWSQAFCCQPRSVSISHMTLCRLCYYYKFCFSVCKMGTAVVLTPKVGESQGGARWRTMSVDLGALTTPWPLPWQPLSFAMGSPGIWPLIPHWGAPTAFSLKFHSDFFHHWILRKGADREGGGSIETEFISDKDNLKIYRPFLFYALLNSPWV